MALRLVEGSQCREEHPTAENRDECNRSQQCNHGDVVENECGQDFRYERECRNQSEQTLDEPGKYAERKSWLLHGDHEARYEH